MGNKKPTSFPGFDQAWAAYPHYEMRSVKTKSLVIWKRRCLEPIADRVLRWVEAAKRTSDWKRDDGDRVPGMQVWLKARDFAEDPPGPRPAPIARREPETLASARRLELLREELDRGLTMPEAKEASRVRWVNEGWDRKEKT